MGLMVSLYVKIVKMLLRKLSYMCHYRVFIKEIVNGFCEKGVNSIFPYLIVIARSEIPSLRLGTGSAILVGAMRLPRFARNDDLPSVFARLTKSAEAISGANKDCPALTNQGGAMIKSLEMVIHPRRGQRRRDTSSSPTVWLYYSLAPSYHGR
jgi:hypothetical protein